MAKVYFDKDVKISIPDSAFDHADKLDGYCDLCGCELRMDCNECKPLYHKNPENGKDICSSCWRIM